MSDCLQYASEIDDYMENRQQVARQHLTRSFQNGANFTKSGLDQLMPLISPCLLVPGCHATRARRPHEWAQVGILEVMEGFVVFEKRIEKMNEQPNVSAKRKETIQWVQAKWRHLTENFGPFVWVAMKEHSDKAKLSTETAQVHEECTQRLEEWNRTFYSDVDAQLGKPYSSSVFPRGRTPTVEMVNLHMFRAFQLRERVGRLDRSQIDTFGMDFPNAPDFCGSEFPS